MWLNDRKSLWPMTALKIFTTKPKENFVMKLKLYKI